MYELKDSYLTGVKTIDDQHRQIFKLADDAYQLLKDENKLFKDDDLLKIANEKAINEPVCGCYRHLGR